MNNTTLVIGDPHAGPEDTDKHRFDALGEFIVERQPEHIVQIGDFMTYDSISSHNTRKRLTMEGQRLVEELRAGLECYDRMMDPIRRLNTSRARNRKAQYRPVLSWVEGNHEDRALRYAEEHPEMYGMVDYKTTIPVVEDGWDVVPYRDHVQYAGVLFTHVPMSGRNQPIGSKHAVKNVIKDYDCPIVYGHSHKLAYECDGVRSPNGSRRLTALNAGCYFTDVPDYAAGSQGPLDWWAGVCLLHHLNDEGDYDLETVHISRIL